MASQVVTIATIAGVGGDAVAAIFRRWHAAKISIGEVQCDQRAHRHGRAVYSADGADELDSSQWLPSVRREMDEFFAELRNNRQNLPVMFWCEYMDFWSGAEFHTPLMMASANNAHEAFSEYRQMACYKLPDDGALAEYLRKILKKKWVRESQEHRWYLRLLLDAATAWRPLIDSASILVSRECIRGSVDDDEVVASLSVQPQWLARFYNPNRPSVE